MSLKEDPLSPLIVSCRGSDRTFQGSTKAGFCRERLGALASSSGKDARGAVEIAIRFDAGSGIGVDAIDVG
jgi:hypothetical protein